jgi:hypothetical protein
MDPYNYDLLIYVGSWKQFTKYCDKHDIAYPEDHNDAARGRFMTHIERHQGAIWLSKWESSVADHGILGHELIHACHDCLDRVGVPVGPDQDEALAYLWAETYCRAAMALGTSETLKKRSK